MRNYGFYFVLIFGVLALTGCGTQSLYQYEDKPPYLKIEEYFKGPVQAWGIVQDRTGKVVRRFDVDMIGRVDGDNIILEEDFHYYDGKKERRVWRIERTAEGRYRGQAADVIGTAEGKTHGSQLKWAYQMEVPVDGERYVFTFDDWMYLMNDGVVINRAAMKKLNITVAEITIMFKKKR